MVFRYTTDDWQEGKKMFQEYSKASCTFLHSYWHAKAKCNCVPWNFPRDDDDNTQMCSSADENYCFKVRSIKLIEHKNAYAMRTNIACNGHPEHDPQWSEQALPQWLQYYWLHSIHGPDQDWCCSVLCKRTMYIAVIRIISDGDHERHWCVHWWCFSALLCHKRLWMIFKRTERF